MLEFIIIIYVNNSNALDHLKCKEDFSFRVFNEARDITKKIINNSPIPLYNSFKPTAATYDSNSGLVTMNIGKRHIFAVDPGWSNGSAVI